MLVISNHSPDYSLNFIPLSPITITTNNNDNGNNDNDGHWGRTGWILSLPRGHGQPCPPESGVVPLASTSKP